MSCISQILQVKGNKEFLTKIDDKGEPWIAVEGGGAYKEYEYLIVLNSTGHRCGYVAIPPEHPVDKVAQIVRKSLFKQGEETMEYDYDALDIECHGGLTFMARDHGLKESLNIPCRDVWIGFDCGHCYDTPDFEAYAKYFGEVRNYYLEICKQSYSRHPTEGCEVRTFSYVENECHHIIDQLIKMAA